MSSTVYALLFMAMLNGKAPVANQHDTTLMQLPQGSAGKVRLALRMDDKLDRTRPESIGVEGMYNNGRFVRVDRGMQRGDQVSVGLRKAF